jgi:hypothetical protein
LQVLADVWPAFDDQPCRHEKEAQTPEHSEYKSQSRRPDFGKDVTKLLLVGAPCRRHT